jgi:hypothetical protein
MVEPKLLCDKHLLGEHVECHMLAANLIRKRKITNYIKFNLLEPKSLRKRHDYLAREMQQRKFKHKSPLTRYDISYLPNQQQNYKVNVKPSLEDLLARCPKCRKRFKQLK